MSSSGRLRLACEAALIPAASPPIKTSLSFVINLRSREFARAESLYVLIVLQINIDPTCCKGQLRAFLEGVQRNDDSVGVFHGYRGRAISGRRAGFGRGIHSLKIFELC